MPAPIALFAFKRPIHTQATLDSLARNLGASESALTVFCDGPRRDNEVEACLKVQEIAKTAKGFKSVEVVAAERNKGLAKSIIGGVTQMLGNSERLIVIEDDIESSPYMLNFLNSCLEHFQEQPEVMSISAFNQPPSVVPIPDGYPHDIWFNHRPGSWGWATWADRWSLADWNVSDYDSFKNDRAAREAFNVGGADMAWMLDDQMAGRVDSWLVRWMYAHYKHRTPATRDSMKPELTADPGWQWKWTSLSRSRAPTWMFPFSPIPK